MRVRCNSLDSNAVQGTAGSVRVTLKPAPQGIGLVTGDISKKVLELAGIKDVWTFARGQTRTTIILQKLRSSHSMRPT